MVLLGLGRFKLWKLFVNVLWSATYVTLVGYLAYVNYGGVETKATKADEDAIEPA